MRLKLTAILALLALVSAALPATAASPGHSYVPATATSPGHSYVRAAASPGRAHVPAGARAVNTSRPDRVIGTGTPASCTSAKVVAAVAKGGIIRFSCGDAPVTIKMTATAKVRNTSARVVIDGGGKVTLSGMGARRVLYMNTCDRSLVWTTSHCDNQATPRLVLQNLTFADGDSSGDKTEGGGGGAVLVRGGQVKVVNSRFLRNRCDPSGADLGGAALRVLNQYRGRPVYVVGSTFTGGVCSNGGALSSIGVSWHIINSVFTGNKAIGSGANPARRGTRGGGSGGAIYNDGNRMTLRVSGSTIRGNTAREGGGAIFYVSNDRTGTLAIDGSVLTKNKSARFQNYPGIFFLGAGKPKVTNSTLK